MMTVATAVVAMVVFLSVIAFGSDPDPLQDFCVALQPIPKSKSKSEYVEDPYEGKKPGHDEILTSKPNSTDAAIIINGAVCKDPKLVVPEDFLFKQLSKPGNANSMLGSVVTAANIGMFFGLNTLGISLARIDFLKDGVNPPHVHPRATEVLIVIEGSLKVGFVASDNKLFTTTVNKGETFVFPRGLVHFQQNVGHGNAFAFAALSSQNPGTQQIGPAVFGSDPPISDSVLQKAFGLNLDQVRSLQKTFGNHEMKPVTS